MQQAMKDIDFSDVKVEEFKCLHPEISIHGAVETFYGIGNPSVKLLQKGFGEDFIKQTRPHFRVAHDDIYESGRKQQYEFALLAISTKLKEYLCKLELGLSLRIAFLIQSIADPSTSTLYLAFS